MSKTKTTAKKFAAGVVSFAMSVSFVFGGAALPAQAQTVEELTAQINSLLSTISALQAQLSSLQGGSSTTSGSGNGFVFNVNLSSGDTGNDVMELQKFLNTDAATQVATSGAGSPGNETSYFGPATKAAVIKFQDKYASEVLAPVGLSAGTGYFGSSSRAKANALNAASTGSTTNNGGTTTVTPTGSTLNVSLAASSPSQTVLVTGQGIGDLGHFTFTNTSATDAKVTNLKFNRTGVSADSVLSNVYLFNGAVRLTDSATVSSGVISFASPTSGLFTVPAGTSVTVSVRSDISGGAGQVVGVSLSSVESDVAVGGTFPIAAANHSIASGKMGTVAFTYTGPTGATENPANDVRVFEAQTVVSTNDASLESLTLENRGTSADGDVQNFRLFVDGVQVGSSVAQASNDKVVFDLTSSPVTLETGTRIVKVLADIVKGSSETYDFQIRRTSDARFIDTEFTQPILSTDAGDSSFPVSAASANTIAAGSLSIVRAANSPTGNVTVGATNVLWSSLEFRATGEDIKIEAATVDVDTTAGDGMDNVKVFVNGSQVGSTRDVGSAGSETGTEFTFGSSFIAKAGEVTKVDIYGDAKEADATNFAAAATVDAGISVAAADTEGMNSGNTVSAISEVEGNSRTIAASSLTATKSTAYSDQTFIAGTNNAKIGSFVLSAGSTEGINVNTIVVNLPSADAASITDLRLEKGGTALGTTKTSPSTDNSFSVNLAIPASGTETIDIYANVKSGADAGTIVATIDSTTGGTGATTANSTTVGSPDVTLQTVTIGSGTLTVTMEKSPDNRSVLAGTSDQIHVGTFQFDTDYSQFTVQELKVKVPADAATSVDDVILKSNGSTLATAKLTISSGAQTHATATFTGLSFEIAKDDVEKLDVYVTVPTIQSGARSGKEISVLLDADEGFKAVDAAGSSDTSLAGSDLNSAANSGQGTVIVRKSIPTLAAVSVGTTLDSGTTDLAKVSVTADAAGDIGWKKIVFSVKKTAALSLGATTTLALYDDGGNAIAGTFATTTGDLVGGNDSLDNLTSGNLIFVATTEEVVEAGSTETYRLEGSVDGIASGNNYVEVSIPSTSTSQTTGTYASHHTAVGDSTESFVWTDRSVIGTAHSESTSDWTNDYKVGGLSSKLQLANQSQSI